MAGGFLGMRGTADWVTDQRPTNFRQGMLTLFPNGSLPMTAISSRGTDRKVNDPKFTYFSKTAPLNSGILSNDGVYTGDDLGSAHSGTLDVGVTVYAKVTEAIQSYFRPGHTVILVNAADATSYVFGEVVGLTNTAGGRAVAVTALKAAATGVAAAATYIDNIGDINVEGGYIPQGLAFDADAFFNYTQIFRTPLDITRTARLTKLRTGDAYREAKREALLLHGMGMEMTALTGEKVELGGAGTAKKRTTQGAISFIGEHQSDNVQDYPSSTALAWLDGGRGHLNTYLEVLFRYGREEKLAVCGNGALLAINDIAAQDSQFTLTTQTRDFGINVTTFVTPFGIVHLKTHPLFTQRVYRNNDMLIYEPENMTFAYLTDTVFKKDDGEKRGGTVGYDGTKEEFLTEGGYEWHHPETMMYLTGIGDDGTA